VCQGFFGFWIFGFFCLALRAEAQNQGRNRNHNMLGVAQTPKNFRVRANINTHPKRCHNADMVFILQLQNSGLLYTTCLSKGYKIVLNSTLWPLSYPGL